MSRHKDALAIPRQVIAVSVREPTQDRSGYPGPSPSREPRVRGPLCQREVRSEPTVRAIKLDGNQLGELGRDTRHRIFCSTGAASRAEQGADFAKSFICCFSAGRTPTLPTGQNVGGYGRTERGSGDPGAAWLPSIACAGVVALCRWACAHRGCWAERTRPCPRAYLHRSRDQSRGPSLRPRCSSRPSPVLRPPLTPAALRSLSPFGLCSRPCPTWAAQTGLSRSPANLVHVLLPIPRRDPRCLLTRSRAPRTWPSP